MEWAHKLVASRKNSFYVNHMMHLPLSNQCTWNAAHIREHVATERQRSNRTHRAHIRRRYVSNRAACNRACNNSKAEK